MIDKVLVFLFGGLVPLASGIYMILYDIRAKTTPKFAFRLPGILLALGGILVGSASLVEMGLV